MIFFGTRSLQRAIDEYCAHFHQDRPHQGLGNELITPAPAGNVNGEIIKSERLGRFRLVIDLGRAGFDTCRVPNKVSS